MAEPECQVRRFRDLLSTVVCDWRMPIDAIVEGGIESSDLAGLAKVVLKDMEKLFRDAVFPFSSQRKTAFPEFLECPEQHMSNKQNNRTSEARMGKVVSLGSNTKGEKPSHPCFPHSCSASPHAPSRSRMMCCAQRRARVAVHQRRWFKRPSKRPPLRGAWTIMRLHPR